MFCVYVLRETVAVQPATPALDHRLPGALGVGVKRSIANDTVIAFIYCFESSKNLSGKH
jgi:hypothetical protein